MRKIKFIEPKEIEMVETEDPDPDYIPVYLDMVALPKYANLIP